MKVIALTNARACRGAQRYSDGEEAGYNSLEFDGLVGVLGPKDMPLRRACSASPPTSGHSRRDPEIIAKLAATGQVVNPGTPEEFAKALKDQTRHRRMAIGKTLGIKPAQP